MMSRSRILMAAALAAFGDKLIVQGDTHCIVDEAHTLRIKPPALPLQERHRIATSSIGASVAKSEHEGWPKPTPRVLSETELAAQAKRDRKAAKRRVQS